jgi:hypothetical protein
MSPFVKGLLLQPFASLSLRNQLAEVLQLRLLGQGCQDQTVTCLRDTGYAMLSLPRLQFIHVRTESHIGDSAFGERSTAQYRCL